MESLFLLRSIRFVKESYGCVWNQKQINGIEMMIIEFTRCSWNLRDVNAIGCINKQSERFELNL